MLVTRLAKEFREVVQKITAKPPTKVTAQKNSSLDLLYFILVKSEDTVGINGMQKAPHLSSGRIEKHPLSCSRCGAHPREREEKETWSPWASRGGAVSPSAAVGDHDHGQTPTMGESAATPWDAFRRPELVLDHGDDGRRGVAARGAPAKGGVIDMVEAAGVGN